MRTCDRHSKPRLATNHVRESGVTNCLRKWSSIHSSHTSKAWASPRYGPHLSTPLNPLIPRVSRKSRHRPHRVSQSLGGKSNTTKGRNTKTVGSTKLVSSSIRHKGWNTMPSYQCGHYSGYCPHLPVLCLSPGARRPPLPSRQPPLAAPSGWARGAARASLGLDKGWQGRDSSGVRETG